MSFHPLDRLEAALRANSVTDLLLVEIGALDLPSIAELMSLRWSRWRATKVDLLAEVPGLNAVPSIQRWRQLSGQSQARRETEPHVFTDGLYRLPSRGSSHWKPGGSAIEFQERFGVALRQRGMKPPYCYALPGALAELASNAGEHAHAPVPPVASFEVSSASWSIAVTDVGRGALASLRQNTRYRGTTSDLDALQLVLQDGVTGTGQPGRGLGFTSVFKALVDRNSRLRFRTGGASGTWQGQSPTAQSLDFQGLPFRRTGFHVHISGPMPRA